MATAVKNTPETTAPSLFDRAAAVSLVGVVYVVGCFGIVFKLLPYLFWDVFQLNPNSPALDLGVAVLMLVVATALIVLGVQLLGTRASHGTRAGIFVGVVGVLLILLLTRWASIWLEHWAFQGYFSATLGAVLTVAVGLALLIAGGYYFLHPKFETYLVVIEDQGWFSVSTFKNLQGVRVRRGTIVGILLIVGAGLWTLYSRQTLERLPPDWKLNIPFTGKTTIDLVQVFGGNDDLKKQFNALPRADRTPQHFEELVVDFVKDAGKLEPVGLDVDHFLANRLYKTFGVKGKTLVVDPYALRDFNKELAKYVKIESMGGSDQFSESTVVEKSKFDQEVKKLRDEKNDSDPPTMSALPPIRGPETFATILLLPLLQYTLLFLIAGLCCWMAWRIVNYPAFADFLIATEAELNKVSWTTRKKLVQDTIVVLATVFLMTVYLFAMDQAWSQLLSWKVVRILQIQPEKTDPNESLDKKPW